MLEPNGHNKKACMLTLRAHGGGVHFHTPPSAYYGRTAQIGRPEKCDSNILLFLAMPQLPSTPQSPGAVINVRYIRAERALNSLLLCCSGGPCACHSSEQNILWVDFVQPPISNYISVPHVVRHSKDCNMKRPGVGHCPCLYLMISVVYLSRTAILNAQALVTVLV